MQAQVHVQDRGTDTGTGTNLGPSVSNKSTVRVLCWDNVYFQNQFVFIFKILNRQRHAQASDLGRRGTFNKLATKAPESIRVFLKYRSKNS